MRRVLNTGLFESITIASGFGDGRTDAQIHLH